MPKTSTLALKSRSTEERSLRLIIPFVLFSLLISIFGVRTAQADENLLGYVKGAEPLPQGAWEIYEILTLRNDKGSGRYQAIDSDTEFEYGVTDRFSASASFTLMNIDTSGILIDGYLPKDEKYFARPAGAEVALKYNFLSPAKDDFGLASYLALEYRGVDRHSGQKKDTLSWSLLFLFQKYFLEGQLIWVANVGAESTYSHRAPLSDLPADFDWPEVPEMELEPKLGTGVSYRFAPSWFIGAETLYEAEYETEVGLERWSVFAGPSLHYGSASWWGTLTYFRQLRGGGETYEEQDNKDLHLVEKTKDEVRLKVGFNF